MTGKSQSEAVNILRNTKFGAVVTLVVSRQVDEVIDKDDTFALPRELVPLLIHIRIHCRVWWPVNKIFRFGILLLQKCLQKSVIYF